METGVMVWGCSRDELMDLAQLSKAVNHGMSWDAIRWKARCMQVDCNQRCDSFASYEAVSEWRQRHTAGYGHQVVMKWEWDSPDGRCGGCSEKWVMRHFGERS